ncbi:multicopper oxidase domain-containing protein [Geomobilimonas luticola]|uniref:Multicopper oxidase domain-containing protein n=1 Tax=Geomobilimonas luticola TaxID=1114878 RepID=A0ABS5SER7_9BACT|nr:multicopper oxidase domain-containing protein [Geomobilimonas luticola]MBT0653147.1 multicopper oxidase domain-containing protein [Geomobilimonas luticola]
MSRRKIFAWSSLALAIIALAGGIDEGHARPVTVPGGIPDYFETPNWANSPPLRKFVDTLPPLGCTTTNNLGQCIPVAVPDQTTYQGSDYYEIELVEYREQMHSDLPPVVGNKMTATSGGTKLRGYRQVNTTDPNLLTPHYLGPLIVAQKDRPVRIKFINKLPTGTSGNLFIPVDTTVMGSGEYRINYDPATMAPVPEVSGTFSQNRATLHLHGGRTPWISDGTPHQWITPAGESTGYPKGVSVQNVPDMPDPGPGAQTFYYTNQQSARLMFYHDHAWGITRLNVYVGEAAGYLIEDPVEKAMINGGTIGGKTFTAGTIPADQIPLIIQDKTFVRATNPATDPMSIRNTDPTWNWGSTPGTPVNGDLWWPHVYMPAQNPFNPDLSGINPMGRWHYGPWFFPSTPTCGSSPDAVKPFCVDHGPVANIYYDCGPGGACTNPGQPPEMPGTPNVSWGAEAFLDTMVVNGTAYPSLTVDPKAYRFRILNAAHDRFLNLQLYQADPTYTPFDPVTGLANPGYQKEVKMVPASPHPDCSATVTTNCTCVTGFTPAGCFPATWPTDGREGGVPDPALRGPAWIQIGTEGGFLPAPVVLNNTPVKWNVDPTMFNVGNVLQQADGGGTLFLGPAERGDVIVDFSQYAGKTLILYNDAPTAFPALDPHYDYYTGAPDRTDIGGYTAIPAGYGPNIRTVMQIKVNAGANSTATPDYYNPATLTALQDAFKTTATAPGAFSLGQDPIVVGQTAYNSTYNTTFPATWPNWGVSRISDGAISFQKVDGTIVSNFPMKPKAIHDEMGATFDDYGRMSAKLGLELPFTNAAIANFILQNYVDPATEVVKPGQVQIWRITHNGVDTHPIHFHLFDVQVLNRVGWDGFIRLPDTNELGWKDTVRMSPLEDTIVALRPVMPTVPFPLPESVRPLNPMTPLGDMMGFSQIDTTDGGNLAPPMTNRLANFGFEYVWHCHILSHEENDMMRPVVLRVKDSLGVFNNGDWYQDYNSNGAWNTAIDKILTFGTAGDIPVSGDWNGSGTSKLGLFNNGTWTLDTTGSGVQGAGNTTYTFGIGIPGAVPVTGDWTGNGKGTTKIGVFTNGTWYLDLNGNGAWDGTPTDAIYNFGTGLAGAIPVTGDWTGNGTTKIGVFVNGTWYLDLNGNGAWDGTPTDAMYVFGAGVAGALPATGDWTGTGSTRVGIYANGTWYLDLNGNGAWDGTPTDATHIFGAGMTGAVPVIGKW